MSECRFVLVTGNPNKVDEARRITGLQIEAVRLELPEIQSLDLAEVLAEKCDADYQRDQRVGTSEGAKRACAVCRERAPGSGISSHYSGRGVMQAMTIILRRELMSYFS